MAGAMSCPFCGYQSIREYDIRLHIESEHAEAPFPFVASKSPPKTATTRVANSDDDDDEDFIECPMNDCGEVITAAELEDHLQLHDEEEPQSCWGSQPGSTSSNEDVDTRRETPRSTPDSGREAKARREHQRRSTKPPRQVHAIDAWKRLFQMPSSAKESSSRSQHSSSTDAPKRKRLGRSELGKYAHENQMPDWLVTLLKKGKYVKSEGMIFVLKELLEQSSSTDWAFMCHPCVQHISKLRREGGFCGYRNIQMLSTYIIESGGQGSVELGGKIPSIFRIQDYIEKAWDMGINTHGRAETGGVKGTRKYIGTPEAQAVLISLGIPCEAQGFKDPVASVAAASLVRYVMDYFSSATFDPNDKVRLTDLPPIYFQHRGHSLTIVGLERRISGEMELLVFDPMFHDPPNLIKSTGIPKGRQRSPHGALKLYRRGHDYLKKYHEFEVLTCLRPSTPLVPDDPQNPGITVP